MNKISYMKIRFNGEHIWLRVIRITGDKSIVMATPSRNHREAIASATVMGRLANHPVNPVLLFGQLISVPVKQDIFDIRIYSNTPQ